LVNLPAWLAVLRGDLSVVGPYALDPAAAPSLAEWAAVRFDVRPGLTGFWRVGARDDADPAGLARLDAYYVQNWSMGLDFRLLLQSLGSMLLGRSATPPLGSPPASPGGL
jgi:lipopolysaccharide/colanic/teichoic acid biosynthesis glycosyltransferase